MQSGKIKDYLYLASALIYLLKLIIESQVKALILWRSPEKKPQTSLELKTEEAACSACAQRPLCSELLPASVGILPEYKKMNWNLE